MKTKLIQPILSAMVAIAKLSASQPGRVKTLSEHPFPYPQQVTLPSWQLKNSKTAIVAGKSPGQRYILQKGDITATITACLNPNAPSTVTEQQFISNKYRHNLHFFA